ncbi:hypothetical protein DSO57_1022545 [Entomophthora muscae]|uniref:Uncharacterized protein n=1 Tax=Entomophthora muscae TaxID=34485 RepID=A0ACC2TRI3_9FUNG|nr:hypothetical protein DSO57_1022545 [Entomophthora muscae]
MPGNDGKANLYATKLALQQGKDAHQPMWEIEGWRWCPTPGQRYFFWHSRRSDLKSALNGKYIASHIFGNFGQNLGWDAKALSEGSNTPLTHSPLKSSPLQQDIPGRSGLCARCLTALKLARGGH